MEKSKETILMNERTGGVGGMASLTLETVPSLFCCSIGSMVRVCACVVFGCVCFYFFWYLFLFLFSLSNKYFFNEQTKTKNEK